MRRVLLFAALFACNTDSFDGDGGTDAPVDNVVGGGDGSFDAPKDVAPKPPPHFCETIDAQFCADFDVPNDAGVGFTAPQTSGGWTFDFAPSVGIDASTAVQVFTAADASGIARIDNPKLATTNGGPKTVLIVEADVFLKNVGPVADPIMVFSAGADPSPLRIFGLAGHTNAWRLARRAGGVTLLTPQPPTGEWLHATLTIDLDPLAGSVTLLVGSSIATVSPGATETDAGSNPGYIAVGADDQNYPSASVGYLVDNVIARWQ